MLCTPGKEIRIQALYNSVESSSVSTKKAQALYKKSDQGLQYQWLGMLLQVGILEISHALFPWESNLLL